MINSLDQNGKGVQVPIQDEERKKCLETSYESIVTALNPSTQAVTQDKDQNAKK